jgi:hypothetical protein
LLAPSASAATPPDCSPGAAAGKPPPPPVAQRTTKAFGIFWHLGTQLEDIADAKEGSTAWTVIGELKNNVNGYYVNVHANQLGYWVERPAECAVNFARARDTEGAEAVTQLRQGCDSKFAASLGHDAKDRQAARDAYRAALDRVLRNLDLKGEQARGKPVMGEMVLANRDFHYDDAKRELSLRYLPTTYCYLSAAGVSVNSAMVYQSPPFQIKKGSFLLVPRSGSIADVADPRKEALPFNLRLVDQLSHAFAEAGAPLSRFAIHVRRWNNRLVKELAGRKDERLGGVFFEGGTEIISSKRRSEPRIENFAEGIAWLLNNSQEKIFLLMPGFWEKDKVTSTEDRDDLIPRLRKTVTLLNQKIGEKLDPKPAEPAICNARLTFIPASYGRPVHVKTLPAERNGKLAGTVAGEIMLLAQMRREMCGVAQ